MMNGAGYTALEVYLNSLMGEELDDDFTSGITAAVTARPEISYDAATATLYVSENAIGCTLAIYTTDGKLLSTRTVRSTGTRLGGMPKGVILLRVSGNGLCPRILKVKN